MQSPHPCTNCVPIRPPQYVLLLRVDRHAVTRRADLEGWRLEKERKYAVCPFWTKLIRIGSVANDRAMIRTPEHARSKLRSKTYGVPRQNVPSNQSINQGKQTRQLKATQGNSRQVDSSKSNKSARSIYLVNPIDSVNPVKSTQVNSAMVDQKSWIQRAVYHSLAQDRTARHM